MVMIWHRKQAGKPVFNTNDIRGIPQEELHSSVRIYELNDLIRGGVQLVAMHFIATYEMHGMGGGGIHPIIIISAEGIFCLMPAENNI